MPHVFTSEELEPSIKGGEVWFYAYSERLVLPVVVLPFHNFKNGVRAWTSLNTDMKLQDATALHLIVRR